MAQVNVSDPVFFLFNKSLYLPIYKDKQVIFIVRFVFSLFEINQKSVTKVKDN